ncbi:LysE family transporter [Flavobacteriales bacterium]|nr:LysE family transporter [Flavobacteriales bacterium]
MLEFLPAVPLGILLSFSFGPLFFILLETSISKGIKQAFFIDVGVVAADITFFSVAYFGASKLITEENQPALFVLGGVLLSSYGVLSLFKTYKKRKKQQKGKVKVIETPNLFSLAVKGYLLNIINVAVLFFWTGVLFVIGPKFEMETGKMWLFFLATVSTYIIVNLCKYYFASKLKTKLTDSILYKMKQVLNLFVFVFGVYLVVSGSMPSLTVLN